MLPLAPCDKCAGSISTRPDVSNQLFGRRALFVYEPLACENHMEYQAGGEMRQHGVFQSPHPVHTAKDDPCNGIQDHNSSKDYRCKGPHHPRQGQMPRSEEYGRRQNG